MISRQVREAAARIIAKDIGSGVLGVTDISDISDASGVSGEPTSPQPLTLTWEPLSDGSINNTYRILAPGSLPSGSQRPVSSDSRASNSQASDASQWFCKINTTAGFPEMFEKEIRGLALLKTRGGMQVPRVIGYAVADGYQVLVLEWIGEKTPDNPAAAASLRGSATAASFWTNFGESLARLHRVQGDSFGLEEDNYMGALPQSNIPSDRWTDFFAGQRLEPQVRLAAGKSLLDRTLLRVFENLYKCLPELFPEEEPPVLLHGDLWSGNFLRGPGGQPVLIDPAVYYGHRSMDLAMTTLFGGFDRRFYESYNEHYPLPANYEEQWAVCNLYPLLIHLNLFGVGYLGEIRESLERFS